MAKGDAEALAFSVKGVRISDGSTTLVHRLHWAVLKALLDLIYGGKAATFETDLDPGEAVRALADATPRSRWVFTVSSAGVVTGLVSPEGVVLRRSGLFLRHTAGLVFRGRFIEESGHVRIEGHFGFPFFAQVFLTLWFGAIAVWCVFAPPISILGAIREGLSWAVGLAGGVIFSAVGLLLGFVGYAGMATWKRLSSRDIEAIEDHVRDVFRGHSG